MTDRQELDLYDPNRVVSSVLECQLAVGVCRMDLPGFPPNPAAVAWFEG